MSSSRRSRACGRGAVCRESQRETVRGFVSSMRARSAWSSSICPVALPSLSAKSGTGLALLSPGLSPIMAAQWRARSSMTSTWLSALCVGLSPATSQATRRTVVTRRWAVVNLRRYVAGRAWFSFDQPSGQFASFGVEAVTAVGVELDMKLAALLEALQVDVPPSLHEGRSGRVRG